MSTWTTTTRSASSPPVPGTAHSVAFSPDGKTLATGDYDGTARLWNAATQHQLGSPLIGRASVMSVAFSPDGKILATGDWTARHGCGMWLPASRSALPCSHAGVIWSVAFSPDGKTLATGNANGTVQLWDVATGQQIAALRTTGAVYSVAFSPDGTMLATGSYDGTAQLWDVATGRQIGAFSTGQTWTVFSWRSARTGRSWPPASRRHSAAMGRSHSAADRRTPARRYQLGLFGSLQPGRADPGHRQLRRHGTPVGRRHHQQIGAALASGDEHEVHSVTFSPDGKTLAAAPAMASFNCGTVRYLTNPVSFLCASAGGSFTPAEWKHYVPGPAYQKTCP